MTDRSPYRSAPTRSEEPVRGLSFVPLQRLALAPFALAFVLVAHRTRPPPPVVSEARIECKDHAIVAVHDTGPERYSSPILSCWCQAPPHLTRGGTAQSATFACEGAAERLVTFTAEMSPSAVMTIRAGQDRTVISQEQAMERLRACRASAPPGACTLHFELSTVEPPEDVDRRWLWLALALLTLLAALPDRVVRLDVDGANGLVRARDRSLFRRAREVSCALDDITGVVDHQEGLAFLLRDGTYLHLSEPDGRPGFLRGRTILQIEALIAEARAAKERG